MSISTHLHDDDPLFGPLFAALRAEEGEIEIPDPVQCDYLTGRLTQGQSEAFEREILARKGPEELGRLQARRPSIMEATTPEALEERRVQVMRLWKMREPAMPDDEVVVKFPKTEDPYFAKAAATAEPLMVLLKREGPVCLKDLVELPEDAEHLGDHVIIDISWQTARFDIPVGLVVCWDSNVYQSGEELELAVSILSEAGMRLDPGEGSVFSLVIGSFD
jgi:hypothetical protein